MTTPTPGSVEWYVEGVDTYCKTVMMPERMENDSAFASRSARYRVDELASRLTAVVARFLRGTK